MSSYEGKSVEVMWTEFKEALDSDIKKFIPSKLIGNKNISHGSHNQLKDKYEIVTAFTKSLEN